MHNILVPLLLCASLLPGQEDPRRQFDFWVGTWKVHNRSLDKNGRWVDAGTARARVRPILSGEAILEEWEGQTGARQKTFGISVRSYDPKRRAWEIQLCWPSPGNVGFGPMLGRFRHGRAEFFPPQAFAQETPRATRFTFSDALPDTCRWDMAMPVAGAGWRTTWIMEFSREQSAAATIAAGEPLRRAPTRPVCGTPAARQFDQLHGAWSGTASLAGHKPKLAASLRVSSSNRGCSTLGFLTLKAGEALVGEGFTAWAYNPKTKAWQGRSLRSGTAGFGHWSGNFTGPRRALLESRTARHWRRATYAWSSPTMLSVTQERSEDTGRSWQPELVLELEK